MARPRKVARQFKEIRAQDRRLATFMRRHYRDLLAEFAEGIDWSIAMAVFRRNNCCDEHGQPVSLVTASRTWRRIRREMEAREAARAAAAPPALRSGEVAVGVRPIPQIPNRPGPTAAPVPALAPTSVGASASPGLVALATPPGAPAAQAADGATEQISAALAKLGARRVPMPKRN